MISPEELKRLAFIRGLHRQAGQIVESGGPMAATAILMMHDAVELLLVLLAEKENVNVPTNAKFMDYWNYLPGLTHKVSMSRLNAARRALKHNGILPSDETIRELYPVVHSFFVENTQQSLELDFDAVSLTDMIANKRVRELLKAAEEKLNQKEPKGVVEEATKAEDVVLRELDYRLLGSATPRPSSFDSPGDRWAREAIAGLLESTKLLALDVRPQAHQRFRRICPWVAETHAGTWQIRWGGGQEVALEDARFAIDHVTDMALAVERVFGQ